jgi:Protein kinase domain
MVARLSNAATITFRDGDQRPLDLGETIGQGGEARVSAVAGRPGLVAKIYTGAPPTGSDAKLRWMTAHPLPETSGADGHASVAWPRDIVVDERGAIRGFLMPRIAGAKPAIEVFNPKRRQAAFPGFDRRHLHRTARNLASAVAAIHQAGHVVGDLNESNILVTPRTLVTVIDADSFQIRARVDGREVIWPCPVGKPEYTAPELQGKGLAETLRTPEQDRFALGVLLYQLLMEGNHPFRVLWTGAGEPPPLEASIRQGAFPYGSGHRLVAPPPGTPGIDSLYPALAVLFRRCFIDGHRDPSARPTAAEWSRAIAEAERTLRACGRGHHYDGRLPECPYCALRSAVVKVETPPVVRRETAWSDPIGRSGPMPPPAPTWRPPPVQPQRGGNAFRLFLAIVVLSMLARALLQSGVDGGRYAGPSVGTGQLPQAPRRVRRTPPPDVNAAPLPAGTLLDETFAGPSQPLQGVRPGLSGTIGDGALALNSTDPNAVRWLWIAPDPLQPNGNYAVTAQVASVAGSGWIDLVLDAPNGEQLHLLGGIDGQTWEIASADGKSPVQPLATLRAPPGTGLPGTVEARVVDGAIRLFLNGQEIAYPPGVLPTTFGHEFRVGLGVEYDPNGAANFAQASFTGVTVREIS